MVKFPFYWIKRFCIKLQAENNMFFCPECLTKLKGGNYLIRYETLDEHVSCVEPGPKPYFYCPNDKCDIHGTPDLVDNIEPNPNDMYWDMYGNGDYSGWGHKEGESRIQDWKKKHNRMAYYCTPVKGWLFKKGSAAVNSQEAKMDYGYCLKSTWFGKLYESWRKILNNITYSEAKKIVGNDNTPEFWQTIHKLNKKFKYKFLALRLVFTKKQAV